ncbi:DoxX-like family protein [Salinimonas lutimaris]|uniref:DoxX-like family protein n=1 Tax=Salinimonas lutimaris TaxID=914153 RepID=UPI0010BF802B|nr:DoxX-like family protein [Salinimonas lutimaris]
MTPPNENAVFTTQLWLIRITLSLMWCYQGLVPKVLFLDSTELALAGALGIQPQMQQAFVQLSGMLELLWGLTFFAGFQHNWIHRLNLLGIVGLFALSVVFKPALLSAAFNPVVVNGGMFVLGLLALEAKKAANYS